MKYKVWFDEEIGAVCFKQMEPLTVEDVHVVVPQMLELVKGKSHRYVFVDLSEATTGIVDREARKAFSELADPRNFERIAVYGASPSIRMLAKIILAVNGVSNVTKFFKTEEEAREWLKKDQVK